MKPGDMVIVVRVDPGSDAYEAGYRAGLIGTLISYASPYPNEPYVMDAGLIADDGAPFYLSGCAHNFRLIPPPERADEDFTEWFTSMLDKERA